PKSRKLNAASAADVPVLRLRQRTGSPAHRRSVAPLAPRIARFSGILLMEFRMTPSDTVPNLHLRTGVSQRYLG
ncbi:MAG: hypothetical protein WBV48_02550, partial [Candidatus Acidiferrales bacterium]